jgi:hypothetical protein
MNPKNLSIAHFSTSSLIRFDIIQIYLFFYINLRSSSQFVQHIDFLAGERIFTNHLNPRYQQTNIFSHFFVDDLYQYVQGHYK